MGDVSTGGTGDITATGGTGDVTAGDDVSGGTEDEQLSDDTGAKDVIISPRAAPLNGYSESWGGDCDFPSSGSGVTFFGVVETSDVVDSISGVFSTSSDMSVPSPGASSDVPLIG